MLGAIGEAVGALGKPFMSIIDKKVTDRDLRNQLIAALQSDEMQNEFKIAAKRIDLAIKQAESKSLFVAGARPGFQWTCNIGVFYAFLLQPILTPVTRHFWQQPMPTVPVEAIIAATTGALTMGGVRSREKRLGVAREGGGSGAMAAAAMMSGKEQ